VNIAVCFIRARSNLLTCSPEEFSVYLLFSEKGGRRRGAGYRGRRERREESLEL